MNNITLENLKDRDVSLAGYFILKLVEEGELDEDTKLISVNEGHIFTVDYEFGIVDEEGCEIGISDLLDQRFIIEEPVELVSFKEALERGLKIRHMGWHESVEYSTPQNILNYMSKVENDIVLKMIMTEDKVWEVENE